MDPPVRFPLSPGPPLLPLSPERVNGTRPLYTASSNGSPSRNRSSKHLAQSPSLSELESGAHIYKATSANSSPSHSRSSSDVQSMVARFNGLDIRDMREQARRDEIALRREQMAREMAELEGRKIREEAERLATEMKRYREEARRLRKEVEESKARERAGAKRGDVAMEELRRAKEAYHQMHSSMDKELRKSRKEALASSSRIVQLQEELKATRNSLRITQSGWDSEKLKASKREQEAFTAQYELVNVQEQLEKARDKIKVLEEERDALKTSLKEEEVARIAAEGMIALPAEGKDEDDDFELPAQSPRKRSHDEDKENVLPGKAAKLQALHEELNLERNRRQRAEDQIEFMKMECQFQCCSCRVAELRQTAYVHDNSFDLEMERIRATIPTLTPPASEHDGDEMEDVQNTTATLEASHVSHSKTAADPDTTLLFSPSSGTFQKVPSPAKSTEQSIRASMLEASSVPAPNRPRFSIHEDTSESQLSNSMTTIAAEEIEGTLAAHSGSAIVSEDEDEGSQPPFFRSSLEPATPLGQMRHIHTVTTTTTIPIHFSPFPAKSAPMIAPRDPNIPATPNTIGHLPRHGLDNKENHGGFGAAQAKPDLPFDREAALEQIRARRGRARSMAQATPRKVSLEVLKTPKRDISAPAAASGWRA